ncbi:hypothetical protein A2U01_0064781, partial [Trifolium medium]|nr:hypothetical protein [Trifolium medium]
VEEDEVLGIALLVDYRVIIFLSAQGRMRGVLSVEILVIRRIRARKELFASTVKKKVTRARSARSREWLEGKSLLWMVVMRKRIT